MSVETRLTDLHVSILAAARPVCDMLVKRKLSKNQLMVVISLLIMAQKAAEDMLNAQG